MRAEVRQHTWDSQTNGVVAATFSLRLKGKPTNIDAPGFCHLLLTFRRPKRSRQEAP
jgi:hypothetical protein